MPELSKLTDIPESERTPVVVQLLEVIQTQAESIEQLKEEIARLKGNPPKPKIKPSGLASQSLSGKHKKNKKRRRPGKRRKTESLRIDETKKIVLDNVPTGSVFKGYKRYVVQGIQICSDNIEYLLERWQLRDGTYRQASLPAEVNGHFSARLKSFILYQYYQCHVTQPLLLEQLREYGIDLSSGQLNRLLIEPAPG